MTSVLEPSTSRARRADLPSVQAALRIAREIAGPAAKSVDEEARFPRESIDACREAGLLSALVPVELGGMGLSLGDVAAMCEALGQACANSAMVFAMHQIQIACLVRHGRETPAIVEYMRRLVREQRLMASATTEVGVGGDVRTSLCAVERTGDRFRLVKQAPVISYALESDDIMVTARRAPDASNSDQVIVLVDRANARLTPISTWDTLGFRGTCSLGFTLEAEGDAAAVIPQPYAEVSSRTMLPTAHTLWTSLWLGLATDAVGRARAYIRAEARKKPGTVPPGAARLAELVSVLATFRSTVHDGVRRYEEAMHDDEVLSGMAFALRMNSLKISGSTLVVDIVHRALMICGINGYRNDSPYTLARHYRDALGAALMVNNDRILGNSSSILLVQKDDASDVGA